MQPIPFGQRLDELGASEPDRPALVMVAADGDEQAVTYASFAAETNSAARLLAQRGVDSDTTVVIGWPNCLEHFIATWAAWKLGALVLPINAKAPAAERDAIIGVAPGPRLVLGDWPDGSAHLNRQDFAVRSRLSADPVPVRVAHPGKAIGSGGSTGRPKIIVESGPLVADPGRSVPGIGENCRFDEAAVQLVPGPLYHNMPFGWANFGLFAGQTVVVMASFDAARVLDLIERYEVNFLVLVPTMMRRIADVPGVTDRNFSSLLSIMHSAAPCPPWLKRRWIQLVGGDRLWEGFGGTEGVGMTMIRGDEWLDHPGSVGRPFGTQVKILAPDGTPLPAGQVGEIFMRPTGGPPTYRYEGAPAAVQTEDGFTSLGDLGWLDEQGYLFAADRRLDLIITGGANVYPAEVEGVIGQHPAVADVAVIGLADPDWGRRVHAVIEPRDPADPPDWAELIAFCRERLASYKVPKTVEFVVTLPRNEAGKIRRRQMVDERDAAMPTPTVEPGHGEDHADAIIRRGAPQSEAWQQPTRHTE